MAPKRPETGAEKAAREKAEEAARKVIARAKRDCWQEFASTLNLHTGVH